MIHMLYVMYIHRHHNKHVIRHVQFDLNTAVDVLLIFYFHIIQLFDNYNLCSKYS